VKGALGTVGRLLGGFVFGAALVGCAHWPFHGARSGPVREATLPELLDRIGERTSGLSSLKALLAVEVKGRHAFLASVAWAQPERLRVEGLSPVGSTLFELTVVDGVVRWGEPGRVPEVLGPVETIGRSAATRKRGLPLSVEDMIFILKAVTGPVVEKGEVAFLERSDPFYIVHVGRVEGNLGRLTKRITVDGRTLRIDRETVFRPDGTGGVRLRFLNYKPTDHGVWPYRIVAVVPRNGLEIAFAFKELQFNSPVTSEALGSMAGAAP
jgi:hypothetical protein